MVMSEWDMEKLMKMPVIKTNVIRSRSGKFIIHRTEITDIRPVKYYDKMLNDAVFDDDDEIPMETVSSEEQKMDKGGQKQKKQ